jgi:hypothetical protein
MIFSAILTRVFHKKRANSVEFDKVQLLKLNSNKNLPMTNCTAAA